MTNEEIREKIDANYALIESLLNPSHFVLNKSVRDLLNQNAELQSECKHNFINGTCKFCDFQVWEGEDNG